MIEKLASSWKKYSNRRARRRKPQEKAEDKNRKQFEYLARKGLNLPIYTL